MVAAPISIIDELESALKGGCAEKRIQTLRPGTDLFLSERFWLARDRPTKRNPLRNVRPMPKFPSVVLESHFHAAQNRRSSIERTGTYALDQKSPS